MGTNREKQNAPCRRATGGFTLIEIICVCSIVVLVLSVALVAGINAKRLNLIPSAVMTARAGLSLARQHAITASENVTFFMTNQEPVTNQTPGLIELNEKYFSKVENPQRGRFFVAVAYSGGENDDDDDEGAGVDGPSAEIDPSGQKYKLVSGITALPKFAVWAPEREPLKDGAYAAVTFNPSGAVESYELELDGDAGGASWGEAEDSLDIMLPIVLVNTGAKNRGERRLIRISRISGSITEAEE